MTEKNITRIITIEFILTILRTEETITSSPSPPIPLPAHGLGRGVVVEENPRKCDARAFFREIGSFAVAVLIKLQGGKGFEVLTLPRPKLYHHFRRSKNPMTPNPIFRYCENNSTNKGGPPYEVNIWSIFHNFLVNSAE